MRLSARLLGYLNRAFDKDPDGFLAFRLRYAGGMQWTVADGVLTTTVQGGPGRALLVPLAGYTVRELAGFLSAQPGYSTPYVAPSELSGASALRLVDQTGDQAVSNGDHLVAYASVLHAWIDMVAVELAAAGAAVAAMPAEMATTTADGTWLDFQGSFYGVPRLLGEVDETYARRIIAEVLRPKGNNVALEAAISAYTGQSAVISDVTVYGPAVPNYGGGQLHDGTYHHLAAAPAIYGLFDALVGYDLIGGDSPAAYVAVLRSIIDRLRDAGTQLRAVNLGGSVLFDAAPLPDDEPDSLVVSHAQLYNGAGRHDGRWTYSGLVQDVGRIAEATGQRPTKPRRRVRVRYQGVADPVSLPDQQGPLLLP